MTTPARSTQSLSFQVTRDAKVKDGAEQAGVEEVKRPVDGRGKTT